MKKVIIYFSIFALLISSCSSDTKKSVKDSITGFPKAAGTNKLITEYKPIVQGVWIKVDYINEVIRTKSPEAATKYVDGVTTMYFNTEKLNGDSILAPVGWSNHEGGELTLFFRPGIRSSTIQFGAGDLGYSIENGDTILTTYWPNENKKIIATKYRRILVKQKDDDIGYGLNYAINQGIISGKYLCTDSANSAFEVTFLNSGKVIGFPNHDNYYVSDDIGGEPMNNLDVIVFDLYSKKSQDFYFKITKDTLKLYTTKASPDSMLEVVDKLRYTLIRQR